MSQAKAKSQEPLPSDDSSAITVGMLRDAGQRLHISCGNCGHEREPRLDTPPFTKWRDDLTVGEIRSKHLTPCSARGCGEKRKIWVQIANVEASAEDRRTWGWTENEIADAEKR
jgi:hypothetical protein